METYTRETVLYATNAPPCGDEVYLANQPVKYVKEVKLAPEHRVKPSPLTLTPRAKQYKNVSTCRVVTRRQFNGAYYCGSRIWPGGWTTYYFRTIEQNTDVLTPAYERELWSLYLRNKLQDDKVSYADSIGEWRESVKMLGQGASIIKRAFKATKRLFKSRRRVRGLNRWFKTVFGKPASSKWELMDAVSVDLCIKFGIEPTANVLWDTASAMNRYLLKSRRLQVTHVRKGKRSYTGWGEEGELLVEGTISTRAIAYVTYDMNNRSFTSGNLAESLWAGTSLSFMVDWFWNVGSYLSSFNAMNGVTSLSGVLCHREVVKGTDTRRKSGDSCQTPGTYTHTAYWREMLGDIPYANLPQPSLPTTDLWGRLLSSIEVLASMRKGHSA